MKINKDIAIEVLNECLKTGASYSEIYYQNCKERSFSRRYKQVLGVSSSLSIGVGIRIIKDQNVVYGYTSNLSKKSLLKLASDLSLAFKGEREVSISSIKIRRGKRVEDVKIAHDKISDEEKLKRLKTYEDECFKYSSKIVDVISNIYEKDEVVEIYNSKGIYAHDTRVKTRLVVSPIASDSKQFTSSQFDISISGGLEILNDERTILSKCLEASRVAIAKLSALKAPSGELPVVLGNGFGGVLFHEACGHPLEGSAISHLLSPFSNKLGQMVANPIVNAYDDGTLKGGWGSMSIDDEGNPTTKNQLIKDGKLVGFMMDDYTSSFRKELNLKSTGACRRESYRYQPTTRMTNTYIGNGTSKKEDIIKSVKYGIYCSSFTGGQVEPASNQFIFTSDEAYLIKDGKILDILKPISIIGYGYDILNRITMIGDDLKLNAGYCGASSGTCFVEVGQPTLLISKILVGGQEGK